MGPHIEMSVVVPAFNEQGRLAPAVRAIADYFRGRCLRWECIVVDDGSRDATSRIVEELGWVYPEVRLIRLAENCGKGFAVRSGIVNARGALVLFADADGATPIAELERLEEAVHGGADIAIGSRALADRNVTVRAKWYRRVAGRIFHGLVRVLATGRYADTQCGFKLFRGAVAHDLFSRMRTSGYSFDVELLLMAERRGYTVAEVPVNWTHQPGSKVNLARDAVHMAWDLVLIRGRWLRGAYRTANLAQWVESKAGGGVSTPAG